MNLTSVMNSLKRFYQDADKAERIIIHCVLAAAGAVAVGSTFPILALPSLIFSCCGAVWTMYIRLCKCLEIPIQKNILKVLASAALSNIAANLLGVFALEIAAAILPGVGSVAGAAVSFACIYLSGLMFMKRFLCLPGRARSARLWLRFRRMIGTSPSANRPRLRRTSNRQLPSSRIVFNNKYYVAEYRTTEE